MFEFLLIDLDDTILDFKAQEDAAITKTLRDAGIEPTEEICARYSQINKEHWARMEKGEIDRQQVLFGRFQVLFAELGVSADYKPAALGYMENLSEGHYFLPGAEEALAQLRKKYRLFIVSNCQSGYIQAFLKFHQLGDLFEDFEMSGQTGLAKAENIRLIMERNHLSSAVYVGDTEGDENAAHTAGIPFIYAAYGFGTAKNPEGTIQSLSDLMEEVR